MRLGRHVANSVLDTVMPNGTAGDGGACPVMTTDFALASAPGMGRGPIVAFSPTEGVSLLHNGTSDRFGRHWVRRYRSPGMKECRERAMTSGYAPRILRAMSTAK